MLRIFSNLSISSSRSTSRSLYSSWDTTWYVLNILTRKNEIKKCEYIYALCRVPTCILQSLHVFAVIYASTPSELVRVSQRKRSTASSCHSSVTEVTFTSFLSPVRFIHVYKCICPPILDLLFTTFYSTAKLTIEFFNLGRIGARIGFIERRELM